MNREELAWAAGFYDGEGTCLVFNNNKPPRRPRSWSLKLCIGQTERTSLDRFRAAVGGLGTITGPYRFRADRDHWKPQYKWNVYRFEHAQAVIAMLWPFLCEPKRQQAHAALEKMSAWRAEHAT